MSNVINLPSLWAGIVLTFSGWMLLRIASRTVLRWSPAIFLDLALPATCFGLLAASTARPVFAGIITLALSAGYAYADRAKLKVLAEPVVFTDVFQAFDIFRHPRLALPFPNKGGVLTAAAAVISVFVLLFRLEPTAWTLSPWPVLMLLGAVFLAAWTVGGRFSGRAAKSLRWLALSGDPMRDASMFGPLCILLAYGIIARGERATRQATALPVVRATRPSIAQPVVVVQCESFFDARRLHPGITADLLPNFDHCKRTGIQWGRLEVPCWGANTVRTEFAVLSGMSGNAIGFDRFNPYHRFAGVPINSLAWQMRAEGYRTVCIHPFDRTFYGRDQVMSNLGFDLFLGEEAFAGARRINGFVTDVEVARKIAEIVRTEGPRVFVFAITMENHGPWSAPRERPTANLLPDVALPQEEKVALERYLQSLRNADEMLGILIETLGADRMAGLLAFYGDHLPAFRSAFKEFGLNDLRSDYFIWSAVRSAGQRRDIAAQDLREALVPTRLGDTQVVRSIRSRRNAEPVAK
jgi:hypothetical protein